MINHQLLGHSMSRQLYFFAALCARKCVHHVQATQHAFAAILMDGSKLSWGDLDSGGDSSKVQDQLKSVQEVQANDFAFAAILADGSL